MTLKHQKIISVFLIAIVAFGGFEALIYIINLNQPVLFLKAAFAIYLYLAFTITLLYDLHFKNLGSFKSAKARHESVPHWLRRSLKILISTLSGRVSHLMRAHHWLNFQNYLILPGLLFWPTVILFYINASAISHRSQQVIAFLSGVALIVTYWYLKEAFLRKTEKVDRDIFAGLAAVKIYASAITFGGSLAIMRRFCLPASYFSVAIFCLSFLLIYQALFQHKLLEIKNLAWTILISAIQATIGYFIYRFWGYNFYTAAVVMTASYNLMWGTFHYHLDRALTKEVFAEILLICLLAALMVFSVTNFKARLLDGCIF